MRSPIKCAVLLCPKEAGSAKGLCHLHYQRQRRKGTTADPAPPKHMDVNVTFRCPIPLKERMAHLAALLGAETSSLWREAGEKFCNTHPEKKQKEK